MPVRSTAPNELLLYERAIEGIAGVHEAIQRALAVPGSGAVVLLDLNRFGRINQRFGAALGDRLLARIKQSLDNAVVGRGQALSFAGDQFVVLLPDSPHDMLVTTELLRAVTGAHVRSRFGRSVSATASAGMACYPEAGTEAGVLLRAAQHTLELSRNH